jgi:hypothetical protein
MSVSCDCYVLSGKVCDGPFTSRGVLPIVMCLRVFEGLYRAGQGPLGLLTNKKKIKKSTKCDNSILNAVFWDVAPDGLVQ